VSVLVAYLLERAVAFMFSKSPMDTTPLSFTVYLGFSSPPPPSVESSSSTLISLPLGEVTATSRRPLGLSGVLTEVEVDEADPEGTADTGTADVRFVVETAVRPPTADTLAAALALPAGVGLDAGFVLSPGFTSWIRLPAEPALLARVAVEVEGMLRLLIPPAAGGWSTSEIPAPLLLLVSVLLGFFFRRVVSLSP